MSSKSGSRWWWLVAGAALAMALTAGTWWLLTKQTRGAEIANVLASPVAILGVVAAIGAVVVAVRLPGPGDENLTSVAQSREVPGALGPRVSKSVGEDEQQEAATKLAPLTGRAMTKELFFLAGHPAPLHDAATELRRAGFLVRGQPHDLGSTWSLMAYSATSELSEKDLAILDGIAERCGVDFDGWGTYLGPPELDDGPGKPQAPQK
jgi:hypothetical protein